MCYYQDNAVRAHTYLGTPDHYLITSVNGSHQTIVNPRDARVSIATAFFGYYLQGKEQYADYLTAESVESFDGLAWGVVESTE